MSNPNACPFCGSPNVAILPAPFKHAYLEGHDEPRQVKCNSCKARGPKGTHLMATIAWNSLPPKK